jgi:hexosaminidase
MLLPRPASVARTGDDGFLVGESTHICAPAEVLPTAQHLQATLRPPTGLPLPIGEATDPTSSIALSVDADLPAASYRLVSGAQGVSIAGGDPAGVFYGCQSLLQLLPAAVFRQAPVKDVRWSIPAVVVEDVPRFAWRGALLDVARHFIPKHDVLRFVDLMAMHKLNILHLHLTDDQGWRLEIRRYPKLVSTGAWRSESQLGAAPDSPSDGRPHGGFYTQDDMREIVGYAAARFVTVVPEVDVPGHSKAAIAAYPELGVTGRQVEVSTHWGVEHDVLNTEDSTVQFYLDVFDEIMELFPGPFIGVGGDECPKDQWQADPRTQQLMRERGLDTEAELESWFISRIGTHVRALGRRLYGWDELLDGPVPKDTLIGAWRGAARAVEAARKGFDVVSCPVDRVYLDYRQSESPDEPVPVAIPLTLERAYAFEPVPAGLTTDEAAHIIGGQANIWTEHMDSARVVHYFAFPRLCAIAEVLWSTGERDYDDFSDRLREHLRRLDAVGVEYRREGGPLPWQLRPGVRGRPVALAEWEAFIRDLVSGKLY